MFFSFYLLGVVFLLFNSVFYLNLFYLFYFIFFYLNLFYLVEYVVYLGFIYLDYLSLMMMFLSIYIIYLINSLNIFFKELWMSYVNYFLLFFLLICFMSDSMMMMYVYFESSLVSLMVMIWLKGGSLSRFSSVMYLVLFTLLGSLVFLLMLFFMKNNTSIFFMLNNIFLKEFSYWWVVLFFMFLIKIPMYGFHFWLPKAHVDAPVEGSMVLAGVLLKLGGYGLLRLFNFINYLFMFNFLVGIMVFSLYGSLLVSFICIRLIDLKLLIAYSSVVHMGIMVGGLVNFGLLGWHGSLGMMLSHGLCSSGLFFLANMFYIRYVSRSMYISNGSMKILPIMVYNWAILVMCNMGFPVSMNFFSEILLVMSVLYSTFINVFILSIFLFMGLVYNLILLIRVFHGTGWMMYVVNKEVFSEMMILLFHLFYILGYLLLADLFFFWL